MLTHQTGKMSRKVQSSESHAGHAEEHLGHSKILSSKLASSPTKDEVSALKILLINRD